ncbi:neugrin [Ochotona curzoniae]|uniref:neugrin n=1 Tax=Ochotona curzoniae TaxID=130825 RepID=UPI001B353DD2|nr:neugrin [Ochotona curzoniae]
MAAALNALLGRRGLAALSRCGFATRAVTGPGPVGREPDPDSDWEPEERELQELESTLKRQKKAIRFQRLRRQMEAPGAPPRTLTWEAMDQIRYLHEEFTECWSVPRLAEGFGVSPDVIRRVLKSKFVPLLEQKLKQDQKVLQKAGLAQSVLQLQGPVDAVKPLLASLSPVPGDETSARGQGPGKALRVVKANLPDTGAPRRQKGRSQGDRGQQESLVPGTAALGWQREFPKSSTRDHQLSSSKVPEELEGGEVHSENFSSKVVQRGREFYDSNGNFLYRV